MLNHEEALKRAREITNCLCPSCKTWRPEEIAAALERAYAEGQKSNDDTARLLAIARVAEAVAKFGWGTSVTEEYHDERIRAMQRLRAEVER